MFSPLLTILISVITLATLVEAYRNNNNYGYQRGGGYATTNYNRGYNNYNRGYNNYNNYNRGYQGYNNYNRQYQGYGTQYNRQYPGYSNQYQNYYYPTAYATPAPAPPAFQPSLAQLLFGNGPRTSSFSSSNGINYDSNGNSFIGSKDNGIYLFCNGRGCPGRGRK